MSRRFHFSLGRLFGFTSALCVAAAAFTNGLSQARKLNSGTPILVGWMVAWLMGGVAIGFLFSNNRVIIAFLAAIAAVALLSALGLLLTR